jgi:MFS transporter, SP family, arabinose:H+ symporter
VQKIVIFWSVTVALGGLLFGLDTAVISGAEQAIQRLWQLDAVSHGFVVAIALYGTVLGAALGAIPSDLIGRKKTLYWIGFLFMISSMGSALAPNVYIFAFFRFLGGLAIGSSSVTAPLYISEIAPAQNRGRLVALFQFNIVLGILLAYLANYAIGTSDNPDAWRWMLGWVAIPSALFFVSVFFVPESPRWLVWKRNDITTALAVLKQIDPTTASAALASIEAKTEEAGSKESVFAPAYRNPAILGFLMAFFNQWSGINAIIYYAPRIFESAGLGKNAALLSNVGVGVVNFIGVLAALSMIDRFGRRTLMQIGSVALVITLGLVSYAFFSDHLAWVPFMIFAFILFFSFSQGAVIWVFLSEIFPSAVRAQGQALGSFTHWIFAAIIANIFPWFAENVGGGPVFAFFTFMMVLQWFYVRYMMPETKGTSLE